MSQVRGRFAPSPTGEMHIGNAWTALLNWLMVRKAGGVMVLRVEDLDPDRSRPEYTARLLSDLRWLGLDWDEGPDIGGPCQPYCQDDRRDLYRRALVKLENRGLVYPCYCSRSRLQAVASAPHPGEGEPVYPGFCRNLSLEEENRLAAGKKPALRLKTPPGDWPFQDRIYGFMSQEVSREAGDFIVRRSDGVAAYQLAVVVDDAAMDITHVLRGSDLLSSTPRQLLLYDLLELTVPVFAHVPLLCAADGRRLAKRDQDLTLASLRERGIRPEMVIGYLAWKAGLLEAWRPVSCCQLIEGFALERLPREPVIVGSDFRIL